MSSCALVGAPAPRFELPIYSGGTWSLDDGVPGSHGRALVIVFHRHIH